MPKCNVGRYMTDLLDASYRCVIFENQRGGDRPEDCPERASQEAGHEEVDTGEGGLVPG